MISEFDDIRAYHDDEVKGIMAKLIKSRPQISAIRSAITKGVFSKWYFYETLLFNWFKIKRFQINSIEDFQKKITRRGVKMLLRNSSAGFSVSGIENLKADKGYFFISNHRDIVLDAALLSYALTENGLPTCYIAFGDNLIENQFIGDLMRINKGFIVHRNLPMREQFRSSLHLSSYINSLLEDNKSVWIAQRDGRSKDGSDKTKATILKMLTFIGREKRLSFYDVVKRQHIVPISISYEIDPCDKMKACELASLDEFQKYSKKPYEDLNSIITGIKGYKGRIHLSVGKEFSINENEDENILATAIDLEIHKNYHLFPPNYAAHDMLNNKNEFSALYSDKDKELLMKRMVGLNERQRHFLLLQYANPVENKIIEELF